MSASEHLQHLERYLRKLGTYGTALVDSDEELYDTWNGLLVWNIVDGAKTGVTIRCGRDPDGGEWRFRYDDGQAIAGVHDGPAVVHHELSNRLANGKSRISDVRP
jgi:hypothetical protein